MYYWRHSNDRCYVLGIQKKEVPILAFETQCIGKMSNSFLTELSTPTSRLVILVLIGSGIALPGCADECTGSIETTVLFAKPGPNGGRNVYVDVVNKPILGIKKTLLYEGKEFGTFEHVVIINDPQSRFAKNRTICFTNYGSKAAATGGDLNEEGIPEITVEN